MSDKIVISHPMHWGVFLVLAMVMALFGTLAIEFPLSLEFIPIGWVCLIFAFIFFLLFFQNLIFEANVKALEVFYGKARAISADTAGE